MIVRLLQGVLKCDALNVNFVGALEKIDSDCPSFSIKLRGSLAHVAIATPALLQRNFSRHAVGELATSQTLQSVANTLKPIALRNEMLVHAQDELRHSKMFEALAKGIADRTGEMDRESYDWILENDRRFVENYNGDVIEFVCNVFAAEVRTYSFISGYVSALGEQGSVHGVKTTRVLRRVLVDECRHISYTAAYINRWIEEGVDLDASLRRSFVAFDRNSWIEVAETARFLHERS